MEADLYHLNLLADAFRTPFFCIYHHPKSTGFTRPHGECALQSFGGQTVMTFEYFSK
jgi:hypothetical protein